MNRPLCSILFLLVILTSDGDAGASSTEPDAIVAADGSGEYTTVQEAINAAPQTSSSAKRWVIRVKPGTYKELIYVQREKCFVHLMGEDPATTTLTYNLHAKMTGLDGKEIGTFRTPSTYIDADDFTGENLTFDNSAGPVGQALAIRVDGERVAFRNCRFLGRQDTILLNRGRHYFENCHIAGDVDFIFGGATAFFEQCQIRCRGNGYVTAASTPRNQPFGFVFSRCQITGETPETRAYLGRPWRAFASTIFLNTKMSEVIRSVGWHNWNKPERETTTRYAEYNNTGPGSGAKDRVPWASQLSESEAELITLERVLGGADHWNPAQQLKRPN